MKDNEISNMVSFYSDEFMNYKARGIFYRSRRANEMNLNIKDFLKGGSKLNKASNLNIYKIEALFSLLCSSNKNKNREYYYLDYDQFSKARELAISPGGFLNSEIRKYIYKAIFTLDRLEGNRNPETNSKNNKSKILNESYVMDLPTKEDSIDIVMVEIDQTKSPNTKFTIKEENIKRNYHSHNYSDIIEKDVLRSKLNYIFNSETHHDLLCQIKQRLYNYICTVISFNKNKYHYYQGYHDIGLYIFMLYINDKKVSYEIFQRISEFYLKDYLQEDPSTLNFNNVIKIVKNALFKFDAITAKKIIDTLHDGLYFTLSYVITFFSHNINDPETQMRIFDYILVSHPTAVFYMSAFIVLHEYKKLEKSKMEALDSQGIPYSLDELLVEDTECFMHFQNLKFALGEVENSTMEFFDFVIQECENCMSKIEDVTSILLVNEDIDPENKKDSPIFCNDILSRLHSNYLTGEKDPCRNSLRTKSVNISRAVLILGFSILVYLVIRKVNK